MASSRRPDAGVHIFFSGGAERRRKAVLNSEARRDDALTGITRTRRSSTAASLSIIDITWEAAGPNGGDAAAVRKEVREFQFRPTRCDRACDGLTSRDRPKGASAPRTRFARRREISTSRAPRVGRRRTSIDSG
jgi:hypothetical protein